MRLNRESGKAKSDIDINSHDRQIDHKLIYIAFILFSQFGLESIPFKQLSNQGRIVFENWSYGEILI